MVLPMPDACFSHFAKLATLSTEKTSDGRRGILREVTAALDAYSHSTPEELAGLDDALAAAASLFSIEVRREFARLLSAGISGFSHFTEQLAMDEISISAAILRDSRALSHDLLLRIIREKTDAHRMEITSRADLSEELSDALVQHGGDEVVLALLKNDSARIGDDTYHAMARRAQTNSALAPPLVRRKGVPLDVLQELYHHVEGALRQEILAKFGQVAPEELDRAFARSRERISKTFRALPHDYSAAVLRITSMEQRGSLKPDTLVQLLREGVQGRTAFKLALARLTDVDFDVVDRAVDARDTDTIALLCRGTGIDAGVYVPMAVSLAPGDDCGRDGGFARLYDSVPVEAAQRALRFWKIRHHEAAA